MHIDMGNGNIHVEHASGYIVHILIDDNPGLIQCAQKNYIPHSSPNVILGSLKHAASVVIEIVNHILLEHMPSLLTGVPCDGFYKLMVSQVGLSVAMLS